MMLMVTTSMMTRLATNVIIIPHKQAYTTRWSNATKKQAADQREHFRYIPSEKIGQFFWPPRNGFFGINYHQWTWGNAFWPFLAPPDPWGVSGGVGGGQGGSVGPKFSNFFGATFGFQNAKFWIVWTENTPFSSFLAKFSPPGDQKCPFWAEMVEHKSAFFSKTSSLNCLKMHQNKVLGSILI